MHSSIIFYPLGDRCIVIRFGDNVNPDVQQRIKWLIDRLEQTPFEGYLETVPAYTTLAVYYDPMKVHQVIRTSLQVSSPYNWVETYLRSLMNELQTIQHTDLAAAQINIPVCYELEYGLDLEELAAMNRISTSRIIELHTATTYIVHQLGFLPGFPYMGELHAQLQCSRKLQPRVLVPAGSIGIAGKQTCIYPQESPGGWQIIGRTPIRLFDPNANPPVLLRMGDKVSFYAISKKQFEQYQQESWDEMRGRA
jgi:inhibitor of KinA